ncbi:hypothetical protein CLIB1444_05S01992 [[Candida] jaroonii]|uniref:Uncharacterized protein n=1 Tax=[Candida] jaroonii TaxID=467808 RepID=A0ACA9Y824_9ASCO|nr:hypothetical protein CLIB1444_05S01992 [[Candida] jaroonii]
MFKSMLFRPFSGQLLARSFGTSPVTQFQASLVTLKTQTQYKQLLKKEKEIYKKIKQDIAKVEAKLKTQKKKEKLKEQTAKDKLKHKKLLDKAFKSYSRLSGMNVFVKEFISQGKGPLSEASKNWSYLTEGEKESYNEKANDYNEAQLQIYKPKPKGIASGVSAFVKENYVYDGRPSTEIIKDLSAAFKNLPPSEKSKYLASEEDKKKHQEDLKQWKLERVDLYNKEHGTNLTLDFGK